MTSSLKTFHARHLDYVHDLTQTQLVSLREALAQIPDPRAARGVRYGFTDLLVVICAAILCGAQTLVMIAEWAQDAHHRDLLSVWDRAPSMATLHRVFTTIDAEQLDQVLTTWTRSRTYNTTPAHQHPAPEEATQEDQKIPGKDRPDTEPSAAGLVAVAVDGKEICGAKYGGGTKTFLMAAIDHRHATVVGQEAIGAKTNEIPHLPPLLDQLGPLNGTVVTADALHTLVQQAHAIVQRGGHYVFTVKQNSKRLYQAINDVGWSTRRPRYQHREKAHGRVSTWDLAVAPAFERIGFPHASQVMRLHRTRDHRGHLPETTGQVVYAVTSLPAELASPAQLAELIRGHWSIENKLHWVRDTAFKEDVSQIRRGNAPRVMAVFRNLAISIHRLAGHTNLTATLRHYGRNPHLALELTGL